MSTFLFCLSLLVFVASLATFVEVAIGWRKLKQLKDVQPIVGKDCPRVSILVSALNEAESIEPALRSMLAIDYPQLEIIAIDDRSTDATGAILDRLANEFGNLRVLHITELPPRWLGKTHALYQGAKAATGDYLLFTDADVVFEPSAIARAVAYCEQGKLDHLTVFPEIPIREPLLAMQMLSARGGFLSQGKPWKVRTSPKHFVGMGAFNMVRADPYREAGGHEALALAVFDDVMLGMIMKKATPTQDVLTGDDMLSVEWYRSTGEMFRGFQKNVFAGFGYQLSGLVIATLIMLTMRLWPWLGLFVTDGATFWINLATVVVEIVFYLDLLRWAGWSRWCLLYLPFSTPLSVLMWWHGSIKTLLRGGIDWRGTHYSLAQLREGR